MQEVFDALGIDTSNYTTSAAVYGHSGFYSSRKLLPVPEGSCGLRQSDAVFTHVKQFGEVFSSLPLDGRSIKAIGVSSRPRSVEGSYMPCFLYGLSAAKTLAKAYNAELFEFSHQQGHIAAAVLSCGNMKLWDEPFYCFHISGGTTELLFVKSIDDIEIAAKTNDISIGQLIDRIGVFIGLPFPAGAGLETLALNGKLENRRKITLYDGCCSLSGYENKAKEMLDSGVCAENVALWVLTLAADTIKSMTLFANKDHYPVVYAGGVMSDSIIRKELEGGNTYFASPELSGDNAVGTAYLAYRSCQK